MLLAVKKQFLPSPLFHNREQKVQSRPCCPGHRHQWGAHRQPVLPPSRRCPGLTAGASQCFPPPSSHRLATSRQSELCFASRLCLHRQPSKPSAAGHEAGPTNTDGRSPAGFMLLGQAPAPKSFLISVLAWFLFHGQLFPIFVLHGQSVT